MQSAAQLAAQQQQQQLALAMEWQAHGCGELAEWARQAALLTCHSPAPATLTPTSECGKRPPCLEQQYLSGPKRQKGWSEQSASAARSPIDSDGFVIA
jgi:hypothetical protein